MASKAGIKLEDLIVAYELRAEGCSWKLIGRWLGHDYIKLCNTVHAVMIFGIGDHRIRLSDREFEAIKTMRANSKLSWNAIARYLGKANGHALRCAYFRRKKK